MPHYSEALPDFRIQIDYSVLSSLSELEHERYRQNIIAQIYLEDLEGKRVKEVGEASIDKLLIIEGYQNDWPANFVFDVTDTLEKLGETIFDFEKQDFVESLDDAYDGEIYDRNVLYVDTIEILPEFRGLKVGEHVLKDIANNFLRGCGLFIVDCRPLQFIVERDSEKYLKMRYDLFEQHALKAQEKLMHYYKRTGFDHWPKVSDDYMFYCPTKRNVNFDYIELL